MSDFGLMVDYEYCTGCNACEVACKQEYRRAAGKVGGIRVIELIDELPGGKLYITYFPMITRLCTFCATRVKKGLQPACVKHCMAEVLKFGDVEKLSRETHKKRKTVIWK